MRICLKFESIVQFSFCPQYPRATASQKIIKKIFQIRTDYDHRVRSDFCCVVRFLDV